MNPFAIADKFNKLKKAAAADAPKAKAFFEKAATVLKPIFSAVLADLVARGAITPAQVGAATVLWNEFLVIEHEIEDHVKPAIEDLAK